MPCLSFRYLEEILSKTLSRGKPNPCYSFTVNMFLRFKIQDKVLQRRPRHSPPAVSFVATSCNLVTSLLTFYLLISQLSKSLTCKMNLQDSLQEPKNKTACTAWRQFDLLQTLLASLHRNQAQRGIMGSALQHSATVVHWDSNFLKNIFGRRGTWVEIVDTINLVAPDAFISNIVM